MEIYLKKECCSQQKMASARTSEVGACLVCSRSIKETRVIGVAPSRGVVNRKEVISYPEARS